MLRGASSPAALAGCGHAFRGFYLQPGKVAPGHPVNAKDGRNPYCNVIERVYEMGGGTVPNAVSISVLPENMISARSR